LFFTILGHAQSQNPRSPTQRIDGNAAPIDANDENRDRIARDMAKKANLERQAALKVDTDKLFKLAAELKGYVDKSNENVLSLEVLKKAEEIEKLARSVKDKMKGPN
jgi:spore coat polysaccharide biosynthesis protein SpsF (cytidylyltransferase family)